MTHAVPAAVVCTPALRVLRGCSGKQRTPRGGRGTRSPGTPASARPAEISAAQAAQWLRRGIAKGKHGERREHNADRSSSFPGERTGLEPPSTALPGRAGPGQAFPPTERAVAWLYAPSDRGASALSPQRPARERRGAACPLRSPPSPRTRLGTPRTPLTPVPLHRPLLRDCRVRGRTGGGNTAEINSASADAASRGYCSRNGAVRGARWLPGRGWGGALPAPREGHLPAGAGRGPAL